MEGYEGISDEELISRLRDGDSKVMDFILEKYKILVRSKAKSMYLLGADGEDLIQEGMIGLFKAVRDYDSDRDTSFYTFADLCVSRQMYTAVQASSRKKHMPLNRSVSLNEEGMGGEGDGEGRIAGADAWEKSPEDMLIDRELKAAGERHREGAEPSGKAGSGSLSDRDGVCTDRRGAGAGREEYG